MIQRLRLLAALLIALYAAPIYAVSMGELDLKSALNQRFDAEIVLTGTRGLAADEIIPNLASQEDFERVGVDRDYHLTDLRFKATQNEDGTFVVNVTSSKPIIEPYLNFIVEVIWPNGRILREYTVLLDPPIYGTEGVEKIEPGVMSGPSTSSGSSTRPTRREIPPAPTVSSGRTEGVVTQDDEYGLTGPGDTLWSIAMKVRPSGSVSVQQTMLALQRANPEAFINNNINLLKAGHVLRIPDLSEIRAETTQDAIAEVKVQNEEFEDYKSSDTQVTQLDARRQSRNERVDEDDSDDGELRLLASDQSGARSGAADDGRAAELDNALAVAREDLDRARRSNSELNVRLDDLAAQVETLNDIVKLKDDQLATLRAELQKSMAEPQATTPPVNIEQPTQQAQSPLSNPLVLGGLGLLVAIGLAVAVMMGLRKRREQAAEADDDDFTAVLADDDEQLPALSEVAEGEDDEAAEDDDEEVEQQTSDVIGEAEIYIAYGRFPQAISFLQNAIENEPDRTDIQLKLLEVYVQTEDATAFNLQYEQMKLLGDEDANAKAADLQGQIPGAAEASEASMDATIVSSEPIAAIEEPADDDDDDDLSFDLDDLDAETDEDDLDLGSNEELSHDEAMELGDADLDLDLDAALEDAGELTADEDEEEVDLDLDLDDDIDLDFDDDTADELAATQQLDADEELEDTLVLDTDDEADDLDLDLSDDGDDLELDLGDDGDDLELDLSDDGDDVDLGDTLELDGDDDGLELDLDDSSDEGDLDLGDELDLSDDDDIDLDLSDDASDDDGIELDLGDADDDALELDLDDSGDDLELDLGDDDDDGLSLDLDADDDDALELDLDDSGDDLDLDLGDDDDDALSLDLDADDDDDALELDLDDSGDDDLGLDLDDDDGLELDLDDDGGSKLELARAYIEMGESDDARGLLQEVINSGTEEEVNEANELLQKLD